MFNAAHVLETALLLLAAFLAGATVGSLAKLLVLRLTPEKQPAAFLERKAVVVADRALVTAPAIEPVSKPAQPEAPAEVPTPDFSQVARALVVEPVPAVLATGTPEKQPIAPAREAGKTTSGREVPSPRRIAVVDVPALAPVAAVVAEPPATEPGIAAPADQVAAVKPEQFVAATEMPADEPAPAPVADSVSQAASATEDETAAMRAIEGAWTPRRTPSRRARKVPPPDGMVPDDVVVAEPPARPVGIDAPRGGVKDSLTNIIGILPVIEKALNKIGVYHFDQLGQFSDENVSWLEGHLGIPGRVDREHWREQARELAVIAGRAARQLAE